MKSAIAITSEIDNLDISVKDLVTQIRSKIVLEANSIGIVYCDADIDVANLGRLLHAELGIDIVGLTTVATVERHTGYNDMCVLLSVLTSDDTVFAASDTGELNNDNYKDSISEAYKNARAKIDSDPKLIFALSPYITDLTSENFVDVLDDVSNGAPVFGGIATDHYDLQYQKTFFNGTEFKNGLVFVLMAGNIKPVFAMRHHFSAKVEKKGIITKSDRNLIHRVDDQTFKEFVSSMVPVPDDEIVIYHFQSTPFVMELPDYESCEQPVVRVLCTIDHTTGSGGFLSKMPEGSSLYLNMFQREDLRDSCNDTLNSLIEQMSNNKDYQYNMIFVSTCNARHLLMGDMKTLEGDLINKKLSEYPSSLNAVGFYGFGEICPTGSKASGTAKNRFHNISFALCGI